MMRSVVVAVGAVALVVSGCSGGESGASPTSGVAPTQPGLPTTVLPSVATSALEEPADDQQADEDQTNEDQSSEATVNTAQIALPDSGDFDDGDSEFSNLENPDGEYDFDYVIEAGTAERISEGEVVDIIPADMVAFVGETIRIVNEDDGPHTVGVFYIAPNSTMVQTFTTPGFFEGDCTVHSSGEFVLQVFDAPA